MSEFLQNDSEETEQNLGIKPEEAELIVDGFSRVVAEQNDSDMNDESDLPESETEYDCDYDEEENYYKIERVDFNEEKIILQEIPLPDEILKRYEFLQELPDGVAVMGGVARSIAREIITGEREPIRDIDLVNIVDNEGSSKVAYDTLNSLARQYMPDDYSFGHGIADDTLENYFRTRDFTINQSLILNKNLIVSNFAFNDFQENVIRPTYFEYPDSGVDLRSRLFLKALMMRSVLVQISDSIPLLEDVREPEYIGSFDLALFLNKTMSRSVKTARIFTKDLADWGVVSEEYTDRPMALAKELLNDVYDFAFRPAADEKFKDVLGCDDMAGFFVPSAMAEFHASDPTIRKILAEYDDDPAYVAIPGEERDFGYYTN